MEAVLVLMALTISHVAADCNNPLGMSDHRISDDQITASAWLYYKQPNNPHYRPYLARLYDDSSSGGWCSDDIYQTKNQYIEIDLLVNTKITGIATQGRYGSREYIERYQVEYTRDNDKYRKYIRNNDWKMFQANNDSSTVVRHTFSYPLIARKLRVYPLGEEFTIYCLRMELYGCQWENSIATLREYQAPVGGERRGISMKDLPYDGTVSSSLHFVKGGLGKLTDEVYGSKSLLTPDGSPWVAYDVNSPQLEFSFGEKRLFHRVMVHVNNRGRDIQIFKKVEVSISSDGENFTLVQTYEPTKEQSENADAFAVFINLSDIVAKYVRLTFTRSSVWLLISEIKFFTDSYPPKRPYGTLQPPKKVYTEETKYGFRRTWPWEKENTEPPSIYQGNGPKPSSSSTKGLSFPIILTIALVAFVVSIIIAIIVYKKYKQSKTVKREPVRARSPTNSSELQSNKQNMALLYDERLVPAHNGMYIQQNGYPTKVVLT